MIIFFEYPLILEVIEETFGECLGKFWKKNGREFQDKKKSKILLQNGKKFHNKNYWFMIEISIKEKNEMLFIVIHS